MTCPEQVIELVKRFDEHREAYKSGRYNETQLRRMKVTRCKITRFSGRHKASPKVSVKAK